MIMVHLSAKSLVSLRISGAVCSNLVLHWLLLFIFTFSAHLELTSFFSWLKNALSFNFTFRFWLYALPLAIVTVAQGIVSCREYVLTSSYPCNRVTAFYRTFSVHNIIVGFLYAYIGFSIPLIYTSVEENEYSSFYIKCGQEDCLSEERLYLIAGGIWIGLYYFVHNHLFSSRYLDFPFLQQNVSFMIKSSIYPSLKASIKYSFMPVILFLTAYYIHGSGCKELIAQNVGYKLYPGDIDSFINLFSFKRTFHLWLFSTLTIFTLKMMEAMVRIYLMQRYEFAMYHTITPSDKFIMEEGLSRCDVPIIRHLAFWDLALLSENDKSRRKEIYTLSQPGGHPYTWRGIKKQCFEAINEFTCNLEQTVKKPSQTGQSLSPKTLKQQRYESTEYYTSAKQGRQILSVDTLNDLLRFARQNIVGYIFNKLALAGESRPVRFLFGDVPRLRVNHLVLHSLPVAWAAESLSYLLCSSLTEDVYGILQSDIPCVISTLLQLQSALDSLHKNPTVLRKFHSPRSDPVTKMHNTLNSKVKRCLYHLAIYFKPYIADLQLAKNDEIRLLAYCSFKE